MTDNKDKRETESVRIYHETWLRLSKELVGKKDVTFADRIEELCKMGRWWEDQIEKETD